MTFLDGLGGSDENERCDFDDDRQRIMTMTMATMLIIMILMVDGKFEGKERRPLHYSSLFFLLLPDLFHMLSIIFLK